MNKECKFLKKQSSDEGLSLETSALKLFTVGKMRFQLGWSHLIIFYDVCLFVFLKFFCNTIMLPGKCVWVVCILFNHV